MRQSLQVYQVNAFTDGGTGGNPAAVVLDAQHLQAEQKQALAARLGWSETVFVSPSATANFKLEFFTPTRQIAHCGHATIATFGLLFELGKLGAGNWSKETIDGRRQIWIHEGMVFMQQNAPHYQSLSAQQHDLLLRSLGLSAHALEAAPLVVNTGNRFLIIALNTHASLQTLHVQHNLILRLSEELDLIGYYVAQRQSSSQERDVSTRMFAPRYGIDEEAATGMAAGPLACYLYEKLNIHQHRFLIEQGKHMPAPSPSLIQVDLELQAEQIHSLMAGGRAKMAAVQSVNI